MCFKSLKKTLPCNLLFLNTTEIFFLFVLFIDFFFFFWKNKTKEILEEEAGVDEQ